jgi:hypothetical protein
VGVKTPRKSVWELAGPEREWPEPQTRENRERAALYLLLMHDKVPREYGENGREVPRHALHAKRIQLGLGIALDEDDLPAPNQLYLAMKKDTIHFRNPREGVVGCYELTEEGKKWAERTLEQCERGFKRELKRWIDQATAAPYPSYSP